MIAKLKRQQKRQRRQKKEKRNSVKLSEIRAQLVGPDIRPFLPQPQSNVERVIEAASSLRAPMKIVGDPTPEPPSRLALSRDKQGRKVAVKQQFVAPLKTRLPPPNKPAFKLLSEYRDQLFPRALHEREHGIKVEEQEEPGAPRLSAPPVQFPESGMV